jgi:hypothetical protein
MQDYKTINGCGATLLWNRPWGRFGLYLPHLDSVWLQVFPEHLKAAFPNDALPLVRDQVSSHRSRLTA